MMGNKGSTFDILVIGIILLVVSIIAFVGSTVLVQVHDAVNETQTLNTTYLDKGIDALRGFDAMMPFIMVGLLAAVLLFAFFIPTHPVLIIPAIFASILIIILFAQFSNVWTDIATTSALVDEANRFSNTATIMNNLPLIGSIMIAVLLVVMFMAGRRQEVAG